LIPFPVFFSLPSSGCAIWCVFGFSFAVVGLLSFSIDYPFPCGLSVLALVTCYILRLLIADIGIVFGVAGLGGAY